MPYYVVHGTLIVPAWYGTEADSAAEAVAAAHEVGGLFMEKDDSAAQLTVDSVTVEDAAGLEHVVDEAEWTEAQAAAESGAA